MIRKRTINILGDRDILDQIYNNATVDMSASEKKQSQNVGGRITLVLDEASKTYTDVISMAEKYRLNPTVFQSVRYTKAEIEQIEYFQMRILSPLEIEGTDAADYGTQYDGGCPNPTCRLGRHLVGDVLVDRKFLNQKKWDIGTLRPDIYVSEKLKDVIVSNNLTGVSFEHEVKDFKGRKMPSFHVMDIETVLPPMATSAWLCHDEYTHKWYGQCDHQVIYLRSDVQYEKEKLEVAKDFNLSTEYVDNYRLQVIIVSARVRKLFQQGKVHAGFFPVALL